MALQCRVRGHCAAMYNSVVTGKGFCETKGLQALKNRALGCFRRGQDLVHADARVVEHNEIRESAAGVDADCRCHRLGALPAKAQHASSAESNCIVRSGTSMPELPEVETTRAGLAPHLEGRRVEQVRVHDGRLRWPVPEDLGQLMTGARLQRLQRRAKYLIFCFDRGVLIGHLGMSGSFRLVPEDEPRMTHDHVVIRFEGTLELRLNDPRRFGSLHWTAASDYDDHFLIQHLGPEPLGEGFDGEHLHHAARGRRTPIKSFLMDARVVVGVGNIYANEALFRAGIHPLRAAGRVGRGRFDRLALDVREVLAAAVAMGGTTLRDFVGGDGKPGYFRQSLDVYGRGGKACRRCGATLREVRVSQRTTVYCPSCQR